MCIFFFSVKRVLEHSVFTSLHDVTLQKTWIFTNAAAKTLNLAVIIFASSLLSDTLPRLQGKVHATVCCMYAGMTDSAAISVEMGHTFCSK
jgi:hypothetical protein